MKIILYSLKDIHAEAIKLFLTKNSLGFKEITKNDKDFNEIRKLTFVDDTSILKVVRNHSISIMHGFNELFLNQLLEDIKKYKPKIEIT